MTGDNSKSRMGLEVKQKQFNAAMELFDTRKIYKVFGRGVSTANISLQIYLLLLVWPVSLGPAKHILALISAYIFTDFLNGLVHLYMDTNDNYASIAGPLIAAFHLHHRTPVYKNNTVPAVYFNETGSKIWLVFYLSGAAFLINKGLINPFVSHVLAYTGILSSAAEVSHYLAHNKHSGIVNVLRGAGLLLPTKHHARHHLRDNVSYTFLNGFTDPLVDMIAKRYFNGYKTTTDLHYVRYTGAGTENRG